MASQYYRFKPIKKYENYPMGFHN